MCLKLYATVISFVNWIEIIIIIVMNLYLKKRNIQQTCEFTRR